VGIPSSAVLAYRTVLGDLTLLGDVTPAGAEGPLAITQGHIITVYGLYLIESSSTVDIVEAGGIAGIDKVIPRTSVYLISAFSGVDPIGAFAPVDNIVTTQGIETIIPGPPFKVVVALCAREIIIATGADEVCSKGYPAGQDQHH
jgi:hypothetical protein